MVNMKSKRRYFECAYYMKPITKSFSKSYGLYDSPLCPSCGKQMEPTMVAKDFVVCGLDGLPNGNRSIDRCGYCNVMYVATPNVEKTEIFFTVER